ncbi:MAG: putative sugar nucleotidyl transferase, partial [Cyclobacteriaceae bacterium]
MHITLLDIPEFRGNLLPFTYLRPLSEIRIGILTITEKWKYHGEEIGWITQPYLSEKYPQKNADLTYLINGALCPDAELVAAIRQLKPGEALMSESVFLAAHDTTETGQALVDGTELGSHIKKIEYRAPYTLVANLWDIYGLNAAQIKADFEVVTRGRKSQGIEDPFTRVYNPLNVFVEEGAKIRSAIINADTGPVYIGKNSEIGEGAVIRGSFALCEYSSVNMGAKMRGDTTVGPHSKIGGEVANSIIFGYSNKGHDGYMGNSVVGEWCNFGADTNTSNLKNTYDEIKLWNYPARKFVKTGQQFCGLMMGDHSKCGINTMFNSGTVVGICANVLGEGYHRNFIPSFTWGGINGFTTFRLQQVFDVAQRVVARRNMDFPD